MGKRRGIFGEFGRMATVAIGALVLPIVLLAPAVAQDKPLSAIDWLTDSVAMPVALPLPSTTPGGEVATSALPEDVSR
jgi:hypothetical protein